MQDSFAQIQAECEKLFRQLHPLLAGGEGAPSLPPVVKERLLAAWNPQPSARAHCPTAQKFFDDVYGRTDVGRRERAVLDKFLMTRAMQSLQLEAHQTPAGFVHAFVPVVSRGKIVHGLWSGPLKLGVFSESDLATIRHQSAIDLDYIRGKAADVPVFQQDQVDRILELYRELARSLGALAENAIAVEPSPASAKSAPDAAHLVAAATTGVAHHLNSLLSVILGYSSHVTSHEDGLSDASAEALQKVSEAAQRARRVVHELLLFAGRTEEEPALCSVHEVIDRVLSLLEPNLRRGVRVVRQYKAAKDRVLAPAPALHQMIFDMLTMAADSLPPHGGEIGIKTKATNIEFEDGGKSTQEFLRIEVADSAGLRTLAGVDPLALEMLNLDQRVEEENASLLYNLVRRLDGTVMVSTDPAGVTKVEILIPLAAAGDATPGKKVKPRQTASVIWLIDDDAMFREMCANILRKDGHTVETYAEGAELQSAWKAATRQPDLLVVDYNMPDLGGMELKEWLDQEGSRVPVILVSGLDLNTLEAGRLAKMRKTHFLQKPFSQRELSDLASVAMGETLVGA
jgi:CheY-like chemotaxis protein/signal transduction histidine kinase